MAVAHVALVCYLVIFLILGCCGLCSGRMITMSTNHSTLNHTVDSKHALPADVLLHDCVVVLEI